MKRYWVVIETEVEAETAVQAAEKLRTELLNPATEVSASVHPMVWHKDAGDYLPDMDAVTGVEFGQSDKPGLRLVPVKADFESRDHRRDGGRFRQLRGADDSPDGPEAA